MDNALKIKKNMQRTNEMTLADVVAMGGAEAIHAVGGPPILVQLGRYTFFLFPPEITKTSIVLQTERDRLILFYYAYELNSPSIVVQTWRGRLSWCAPQPPPILTQLE